jgi:hypothetical protein
MTAQAAPGDGGDSAGSLPDPLTALPEGFSDLLDGAFDVHVHGQPDLLPASATAATTWPSSGSPAATASGAGC